MNPTFLNKVIYFVLALVAIGVIIFFFNKFLEKTWVQTPTYEESPEQYEFVVFPKSSNTPVYSDESLQKPVASLTRAIATSPSEIKNGAVGVNLDSGDYGFVKMSSLSYLPPSGNQQLLQEMQEYFMSKMGIELTWSSTQNADGTYTINYTVEDDDHARSNTYSYITNGTDLIKVHPFTSKSGVVWAGMLIYDIPVFLVLLVITFVVKRRVFRKV